MKYEKIMPRKRFVNYVKEALFILMQIIKGLLLFFLVPFYCFKKQDETEDTEETEERKP